MMNNNEANKSVGLDTCHEIDAFLQFSIYGWHWKGNHNVDMAPGESEFDNPHLSSGAESEKLLFSPAAQTIKEK